MVIAFEHSDFATLEECKDPVDIPRLEAFPSTFRPGGGGDERWVEG